MHFLHLLYYPKQKILKQKNKDFQNFGWEEEFIHIDDKSVLRLSARNNFESKGDTKDDKTGESVE